MPDGHFDPLPEGFSGPGLTRSGKFVDVEILGGLTVGGSITGGTITGGTITGTTISGGTVTGGAISGGTITGTTISGGTVIAADIYSDNWNGTIPLALPDSGASLGYALDADTGIIQAQDIRAEGGTLGDLTIAGTLTMGANAIWQTAAAGARWVWDINNFNSTTMTMYSNLNNINNEGALSTASQYIPAVIDFSSVTLSSDSAGDATNNAYGSLDIQVEGLTTPSATTQLNAISSGTGTTTTQILAQSGGGGAATLTLLATIATGATVPSASLSVYNNTSAVRGAFNVDAYVRGNDGTAAAPAYSFSASGQTDVGMYRAGTDILGFSVGGALTTSIVAAGAQINVQGSAATPSLYWNTDTNTGIYRAAENQIGFATGGAARLTVDNSVVIVNAGLFRLPVKTTTGDPTATDEGDMYVNTFDNKVRVYADAAWRDVTTW